MLRSTETAVLATLHSKRVFGIDTDSGDDLTTASELFCGVVISGRSG